MSVNLLKKERKDLILKEINVHTRVTFTELVDVLNVSEDTIRRDLNELAEEGEVIKIRGGAMSKAYHYSSQVKETYAHNSKQKIARKALGLLKEGMLVLVGGGNKAVFYAGCGITEDSVPEKEWHETQMKCQTLQRVLMQ